MYWRNRSFIRLSNFGPDKDRRPCGFWWVWFFYVVNQRRTLSILDYSDFMGRTRWKICQGKNVTGRELSEGVLSRPGTLYERDDQQTRRVVTCTYYSGLQNESSRISLFSNTSACAHGRGTGMIVWNCKSGYQYWEEITLRGHLAVYLKALTTFLFLYNSCL